MNEAKDQIIGKIGTERRDNYEKELSEELNNGYKSYPIETRVKIKSTGEQGEAFESVFGTISVFIDDEEKCRYFDLTDVEFLNQTK